MGNTLVPPPNKTKQPQTWQPNDPNRPIKSAIKQPKGTKDTKQTKENKENVDNEQQEDDGYMVEPVRDNPGVFVGNPRTRPNYTNHTPRAVRSLPVPYPQNDYRVFPRQRPNRYSEIPSDDEFRPNVPVRRFINTPLPRPLVTRAARIPTVYPIPYQREPTAFYHRHSYGAPYSYNNYSTYPQYNQPRASDVIHHTYSLPAIPYNNPRPVTVLASARPPRTPYHQEPVVHVHHQHSAPLEEYVPVGYDPMGYEPIVYRSTTPAIVEHQTPAELRTMTRVGGGLTLNY